MFAMSAMLAPMDWATATPMVGSANRLWRVGDVVVKELVHDAPHDLDRRRRAGAFERAVFASGEVIMAEPLAGDLERVVGSRGVELTVRRHRFVDGVRPSTTHASEAGRQLAVVQRHGAAWSTESKGSLHRWEVDPLVVADRLGVDKGVLRDALTIVDAGAATTGEWLFSHLDHKPQNCLVTGDGRLVLLDWDECGHVHPRHEAVEAALRWSDVIDGEPDRDAFSAFLSAHGTPLPIVVGDVAKHAAAILGWFSYQGRRSLGEWATDTARDRHVAAELVDDVLGQIRRTVASVETWCNWT
jgi:hypothetical protein